MTQFRAALEIEHSKTSGRNNEMVYEVEDDDIPELDDT